MTEDIIEPLTLAEAMNEPVNMFFSFYFISNIFFFTIIGRYFLCKSLGVMVGGSALDHFFLPLSL